MQIHYHVQLVFLTSATQKLDVQQENHEWLETALKEYRDSENLTKEG